MHQPMGTNILFSCEFFRSKSVSVIYTDASMTVEMQKRKVKEDKKIKTTSWMSDR